MFLSNKDVSANDFKNENLLTKGTWEDKDENKVVVYVLGDKVMDPKPNVAAFDMDGTLITTKSGKPFPEDLYDWKFLYPNTVSRLQTFFENNDDFKFVIFTNQAGINTPEKLEDMKKKIEMITEQISIPIVVFVAPNYNEYRKPKTGSWDLFVKDYNGGIVPHLETSMFCGDAAGREGDISDSDKEFALNIGITFKTPEEFFLENGR